MSETSGLVTLKCLPNHKLLGARFGAGYKAVQQATKTVANGPIMQGLRLPVNDLSRGATVEDIVQTSAATALQAQDAKRKEMENQWA